ncbi:hypothetical protein CsatA_023433 [Cannabis sativa]
MGVNKEVDRRVTTEAKDDECEIKIKIVTQDGRVPTEEHTVTSDQHRINEPLLYLFDGSKLARQQYLQIGLPLYKAALKNDWRAAKAMIQKQSQLLRTAITWAEETVLHIATGAKHVQFVKELINLMDEIDVALQDSKGNTAFCHAALNGSIEIATIMMEKNKCLPLIRGGQGMTPLYMATLFGQSEMSWFLYPLTKSILEKGERIGIFFNCINFDLYDLALKMFEDDRALAMACDMHNNTALHILARKPYAFCHHKTSTLRTSYTFSKCNQALQLVKHIWKEILVCLPNVEVHNLISTPTRLLFEAAELGNYQFLVELLGLYPDLVWEVDEKNRTIFHIAVLNRHENIFSLIHEIGSAKDIIITFEDDENNNMLHHAAILPPSHKLNIELGGTLHLEQELSLFKEVQRSMLPSFAHMKNSNGLTPEDVFIKMHYPFLESAKRRIKRTTKLCLMISILVFIGIMITTSLSFYNDIKKPKKKFLEEIALFFSCISTLAFSHILTSNNLRIERLTSLQYKLKIGLGMLFISMSMMLLAFI